MISLFEFVESSSSRRSRSPRSRREDGNDDEDYEETDSEESDSDDWDNDALEESFAHTLETHAVTCAPNTLSAPQFGLAIPQVTTALASWQFAVLACLAAILGNPGRSWAILGDPEQS